MRITDWELKIQGDFQEISAAVDGYRLWYRFPKIYSASKAGDSFVVAALLPAMLEGSILEIDSSLPVSPKLLANIERVQEIHNCWNPIFKVIPVNATTAVQTPFASGTVSFFSGGVDSMFTFLKNIEEITHVIFIQGFDFFLDSDTYKKAIDRNTSFVDGFGKMLIPVETNHYPFGYRYNLSRNLTQGSALASIALLFGFPRVYLPAAYSYSQLVPLGSHPLTDPLYSNECVNIIHDGAEARRVDKVRKILEYESALKNLTVCLDHMNTNCGKCSKCLRTMIPLNLLNASFINFPPLQSADQIRKMRIAGDIEMIFFKENLEISDESNNKELRDALIACMSRYERIKLLKDFDRVMLGGILKRAFRKLSKYNSEARRIDSSPPKD
jgi:hypothetical protein